MDSKNPSTSKSLRIILVLVGILVVLLLVLHVGITIGYHKAQFADRFSANFERNFIGAEGVGQVHFTRALPGGHGAAGEIVRIDLPEFVVAGTDKLEKNVIVSTSTVLRKFRQEIRPTDLETEDFVVVIGNPNTRGQIEAKFVRVMPPPPEAGVRTFHGGEMGGQMDVMYIRNQN